MSLGEVSIRRGVTTAMGYLCLFGLGLFSLWRLPLNRLPDVDLPVIAVVTNYTGASPADMETLVSEPIERAVASVENVETVRSVSRNGASVVLVSFTWGTDMDTAEIEVRKNLELFAGDLLPQEASRPLTFAFDPSLSPVVFLALDGPYDGHRLRMMARERVQPYLGRVEGVAAAEVMGGLEREVRVELDPTALASLSIAPARVIDALRTANLLVPSGAVDDGVQALSVQPTSLFQSVEEIRRTVVSVVGGRPVLLSEIATVEDGFQDETHVVTANGEPAVLLAVRKQSDANTVEVARAVRDALPDIEGRLPGGTHLVPLFDESLSIVRAIGNLGITGLQAFLLTGLVLLLFLRSVRISIIAVVAVPMSVLVAFTAMGVLGVTLNLISMAGLALAIGMLVDNGIVVLESTFQYVEAGEPPRRAAVLATQEMGMPLFASTMTTVVVFLPILLVEGIAGELFRDLVLTICVSLLSSLLVALTLVPLMASKVVARDQRGRLAATLTRYTRWLDRLGPAYDRALVWALSRPRKVLAAAFLVLCASLATLPLLGRDFLPKADMSELRIELLAAPGISLQRMRALVDGVEALIGEEVPEATVVTADYGVSEGFSAVFGGAANRGTIHIRLPKPTDRQRSQAEIETALTERLDQVVGADARVAVFQLTGSGGDIDVKLFSQDFELLRSWGEKIRDELGRSPGVRTAKFSMQTGSPELQLTYDRERMRVLGLAPAQVSSAVATYLQGTVATIFREDGDEFSVRVRGRPKVRESWSSLGRLPIELPAGGHVPLDQVATLQHRLGTTDIDHEDQRRLATVSLTASGYDLGGLVEDVNARIGAMGIPDDVQIEIGGVAEDLRDAFFKLGLALAAALLLVYMVLASQFESLLEPFVIMFTVPLSVIGVVLALAVTGTTLQVTALVGVILLGGVVVNNGIVLVDVLKRRRMAGMDLLEAAREAGRLRLRPILMTALTTILGMVPLSLGVGDGAEIWAPMARAVVGGMIVSTLLTLFVIPLLYVVLAGAVDRRRGRSEEAAAGEQSSRPVTLSRDAA